MDPKSENVELEEINIRSNGSSRNNLDHTINIDDNISYPKNVLSKETSNPNISTLPKPQSNYAPTITSVNRRKKKEGFGDMENDNPDSDEENDKKARLKRNMTNVELVPLKEEEKPTRIGVSDSQEFDDFDWFADDYISADPERDDEKSEDEDSTDKKESKDTIYKKIARFYKKIPRTIRYWTWLILGDAIFAIPVILSIIFDCVGNEKANPSKWTSTCMEYLDIFGHPISLWAIWLLPSWSAFWFLKIFIRLLPELFLRLFDLILGFVPRKIQSISDYIRYLHKYIVHAVSAFLAYIFLNIFFDIKDDGSALSYVSSAFLSLFVTLAIWAVEKIILQSFAISFHKSVFEDRIEEINKAIHVLEYLNESRHKNIHISSNGILNRGGSKDNMVDEKKGIVKKVAKLAKNVMKGSAKTKSVLLRTSWDAKVLAKKLYYQLGGTDRLEDELTIDNFREFFATEQECQEAFDLFDKDGNGDLSKAEVKGFVLDVYHEQKTLRKSMRDSDIALRKLDYLFKFIAIIIIVIACLNIFDCNLSSVYVALSSIWVGAMFAISGTITNLVQSLIFLFITHPFDVGDRIEIDGQAYIVKDFGLTNVTMKKPNGEEIYAPTSELTSKFINNIRRSSPLIQVFNIAVSSKHTTAEQIQSLQDRLQKFVEKENRHFQGRCIVSATEILDELRMNIAIIVQHKHNGQDALRVRHRNDLFVSEIKNSINLLKLELPNPSLLIINIANEEGELMPYETQSLKSNEN